MKKDLYNSKDEEHQHIINLLKDLPKVKAADNFEYNLRVKIENKNFDLNTESNTSISKWWKYAVPAAATTAAAIFVVTFTINDPEIIENPFQINPQPRTALSSALSSVKNSFRSLNENSLVTENDVVLDQAVEKKQTPQASEPIMKETEGLAKTENRKPDFPFNNSTATDLDEVMTKNINRSVVGNKTSLAARSNSRSVFNGFFIGEEVDKEYVDRLKARNDSLKNVIKNRMKKFKKVE